MPEVFKCPDCEATFASGKSIGPHRARAHGFRVKDGKNIPKRAGWKSGNYRRVKGKFPCPHCEFIASWKGGLSHHINKKHNSPERIELAKTSQNAQIATSPNGHVQAADDTNHRLEAAATFAAGRVAELLQSVALQHDLPPKSLAALVLRVVHSQAVR